MKPLADRIRPQTLHDVVGQSHILGEGRVLRSIIESGEIPNLIFYGPSGVGKTTVARIIAERTHKQLHKLNGTNASTADIKNIVGQLGTFGTREGVLLYLDEIQYLNKKQQQSLLEYIENGEITLIASTTENPYFYIYNAILSRSTVFEFKPVSPQEVEPAVQRAFSILSEEHHVDVTLEDGGCALIARAGGGDVRKAINTAELCFLAASPGENGKHITLDQIRQVAQKSQMRYDRDADEHYDVLSAFQKSIRGSDPHAALHYLARLVEAGDLISPCRRLLVTACEDISLAYPNAITIVKSCVDAAMQLGYPEARIPLAQAVILLATAPKSNSALMGIEAALADIHAGKSGDTPAHLKDCHYAGSKDLGHGIGYQYAHTGDNHYVQQQYLPDTLKDRIYYEYGDNKTEQAAKQYWDRIKSSDGRTPK